MARKSLKDFKEEWDTKGNGNLDLYMCTAFGGDKLTFGGIPNWS